MAQNELNRLSKKVWNKTQISTDIEQNIDIMPGEGWDCIVLEITEVDKTANNRLYLNLDEMELLITKMREMMKYVKE